MDTALITFMVYVKIPLPPVIEFDIAFASHSLRRTSIFFQKLGSILQDLRQQKVKKRQRNEKYGRRAYLVETKSGLREATIDVGEMKQTPLFMTLASYRWTKSETCG
jgi:hypothetical protein